MAPKAKPGASPPPPRRKSCGECVKAKRRCDLLTPKCTRCFQKTLDCRYVREPRAQPNAASQGPAGQLVRRRPAVQAPFEAEIPSVVDPRQLKRLDPSPATSPEAGAELFVMANSFWNESIPRPPSTTNWLTPAPPTNSQIVYQSEDYNKMNAICVRASRSSPQRQLTVFLAKVFARAVGRLLNSNCLCSSSIEGVPPQHGVQIQHVVPTSQALRSCQTEGYY